MRSRLFSLFLTAAGFAAGWLMRPEIFSGKIHADRTVGSGISIVEDRGTRKNLQQAGETASGAISVPGVLQVTDILRSLLLEKNGIKRSAALRTLVANTPPGEVATLVRAYNICLSDGWQTRELGELVTFMEGRVRGKEGMDALPQEPNGTPGYLMKHRMSGWASVDPGGCMEWLATLEQGRTKDELTADWIEGMKGADTEKLGVLFPKLPTDQQAAIASRMVEDAVQGHGLGGMAEWFKTTGASLEAEAKDRIFARTIDAFTQNQTAGGLQQAVAFLKATCAPEEKAFADGLQQMVWRSARHSPKETLDLLDDYLPQNQFLAETRDKFISQCVQMASNSTVNTIGEWLNEHRQSPIYNDVAGQFLTHVQSIDPEGAKAWAESIPDPAVRDDMLSRLRSEAR